MVYYMNTGVGSMNPSLRNTLLVDRLCLQAHVSPWHMEYPEEETSLSGTLNVKNWDFLG